MRFCGLDAGKIQIKDEAAVVYWSLVYNDVV
jgi:hypothetical protein